ncbi:MAG: serine/threonine-protein kinase [Pseudomonadota bacterium]
MSIDIEIPGYELISELGTGGQAAVYLGVQTSLDRKVAVKVLHRWLSRESEEFKERFLHEGRVLARLKHPNIVSIYDIGEHDKVLYMAMEYVPGGTLTERLKLGNLRLDEIVEITGQIGLALHTTHLKRIVHRDLKPSNVLMREGVVPVLTDFGIARDAENDSGLTQTGFRIGTTQYMSPEQIRGLRADHRSDIYTLGLLLYRLLTGRLPFQTTNDFDLARMQVEEPPPPLPEELIEFQPIIDIALAKKAEQRYQSALDFCKELQALDVSSEAYRSQFTQATRVHGSLEVPVPSVADQLEQLSRERSVSESASGAASIGGPDSVSSSVSQAGAPSSTQQTLSTAETTSGKLRRPVFTGVVALLALVAVALAAWNFFPQPGTSGLSEEDRLRVETYLRRAEGRYNNQQIDSPPGQNAVHNLNLIFELAPDYAPARDLARRIAVDYAVDAGDRLREDDLEAAQQDVDKGLALVPDDQRLNELAQEITRLTEERERLAQIAAQLQAGQAALADGRLVAPAGNNAYEQFQDVLALDDGNQSAIQGLAAIEQQLVSAISDLLDEGRLFDASTRMPELKSRFPDSALVNALAGEIENAVRLAAEDERVRSLLEQAAGQMTAGRLVEPAIDNALSTYTEVLTLRPENVAALDGLNAIADAFVVSAQTQLDQNDFRAAVALADNGLLAAPDDQRLSDIRSQALGQLSEREQQIENLLQEAQRLVQNGAFLPPGQNALDTYAQVEALDPGNEKAARGLTVLPDRIADELDRATQADLLDDARSLAVRAAERFPNDTRFASAQEEVDALFAQRARQERLDARLVRIETLLGQPVTLELIDEAAAELQGLRSEFPGELNLFNDNLTRLTARIDDSASMVSAGGNEAIGISLLDRGLEQFGSSETLRSARSALVAQRDQRIAAEEAAIAAMTGLLAIDAVPWGEVTSIVNAQGEAQELPTNASTPLLVPLLEGEYTVSIRHQDDVAPEELVVQVTAQGVEQAQARFEAITADQSFERSGW